MKIAAWTLECRVFAQFKELRWFIQSQPGNVVVQPTADHMPATPRAAH